MTKHALQYHTNGNHVDVIEKKYSCDLCGYRCREERNLRQHNRIHTGENPVKCKVKDCDMAFRHHSALNRHNRNVHTKVVPRRFKVTIPKNNVGCMSEYLLSVSFFNYSVIFARNVMKLVTSYENISLLIPMNCHTNVRSVLERIVIDVVLGNILKNAIQE